MILSRRPVASAKLAASLFASRLRVDSLLRNSAYVMTTTALAAATGYVYWIIAARMYSTHDVGLASALIATMVLAATMANLGIGPTLIQALPRRESGHAWSLTLNAVLVTGVIASVLTGAIAAIILPFLSPRFAGPGNLGGFTLALIVGVPLLTLAAMLDSTFTAERAAGNMLARTATFALLRIPLLLVPVVLGLGGALVICASWILAAGASLVTGALLIPRLRRAYRLAWRGIVAQMRAMLSLVAGHQLISLGAMAPIYLLPVIVVARLSVVDNAYFYTSWQVGSLFFMVSPSVAVALLAEGSHSPEDILRKARAGLAIIAALLCPVMLVAILGGHLILSVFGPNYARNGYALLAVLVVSAIPDAITNVYVAVLRVRRRLALAALLNLGMATLTLALAWVLLPRLGIVGAGWAWLTAQTAGTLVVAASIVGARITSRSDSWRWRKTGDRAMAATRILLIVDPCSAGESMRIAPYVAMIRRGNPQAQITLVANTDALAALDRIEAIDRVVESDIYRYRPYSRAHVRLSQVWAWLGLIRRLGVGYHLVISFYWGGVFQHLLGYVVCRGRRVGYAHYPALISRWLLSSSLGAFRWTESHPPQHVALLRAAGVATRIEADEVARPYISYGDDEQAAIARLLREEGVDDRERLIVLHPGSDWACQQWLQRRWSELADTLVTRYEATILFTGVATEREYIEGIQQGMEAPSRSLAGRTTLPQMATLLARSLLCVCVDSAVFELTQATSTPAVVLAGPSRPDTGVYGACQPTIIRRTGDQLVGKISACQDAHNALNEPGCWNYQCWMAGLRDISVADVLHAVEEQLQPGVPATHAVGDAVAPAIPTLPALPEVHPMLAALFLEFDRQDIRWCVLRGEAELAVPDDDIDLLVAGRDVPGVRAVLAEQGYMALPSCGRGSHTFFVGYDPPSETWITLDIVTELTYGPYLDMRAHAATGCLARRRSAGKAHVLAPDDAFWTLLLHCLLDKGVFAPRRSARLRQLAGSARVDGPLARLVALACPDDWDTARLVACAARSEWETLAQVAPRLAAGWRRQASITARWRSITNRVLRLLEIPVGRLRRPRMSVALLGPDGAGKSTLAAEIQRSFFFPVRTVYMGLWKGSWAGDAMPQHPHLWILRRALEIAGRLPKAWWWYLTAKYHQALARVVIFDRYVYDALIASYQTTNPLKRLYMWLLGHSCPAPDLVLILDAPGEVMYARKGEDSPEILEHQRQDLLALRGRVPHVQVVDATRDEAAVRADILDRIWAAYCGR